MSKLFETELTKEMVKKTSISDKREAENMQYPWIAKRRSLLPKGNSENHSKKHI